MLLKSYFMSVNIIITPTGILRRKFSEYASRAVVLLYGRIFFITLATGGYVALPQNRLDRFPLACSFSWSNICEQGKEPTQRVKHRHCSTRVGSSLTRKYGGNVIKLKLNEK
jgi:hypothetical protein